MFIRFLLQKLDLDSFFSNIKRNEKRFCPNCGSKDVEPDERHTNNLGEFIFDLNKWLCNECGYSGIMPLEDEEGREDIDFEPVEQEEVDASAGRGLLKYYTLIMIPSLIVAYLVFRLILG
jgi:ribosomal protein S27AE